MRIWFAIWVHFLGIFLPSGRVVLIPFNLNKKRVMIVITLLLLILNFHVYSFLVLKKLDFFNYPSIWLYRHINHFLLLFVVCISNFTAIILLLFTLLHTKSAAMNSKLPKMMQTKRLYADQISTLIYLKQTSKGIPFH